MRKTEVIARANGLQFAKCCGTCANAGVRGKYEVVCTIKSYATELYGRADSTKLRVKPWAICDKWEDGIEIHHGNYAAPPIIHDSSDGSIVVDPVTIAKSRCAAGK
jgi:hypothetical protein